MVDDASRLFEISDTPFLSPMSATYLQPQISWKICPSSSQLLPCVISVLHRKLFERGLLKMCCSRGCTGSGTNSAPPCWSDLRSKIRPSLDLRSYRYTDTVFNIPTTPSDT